jgi:histidinol phosphatase-like enzyme
MRKIIAVDFDGCICSDKSPDIGEPNWDIINAIKSEQKVGTAIILWTCREGRNLKNAIAACEKWGLKFDTINENIPEIIRLWGGDSRKVTADEYWDDRAVIVKAFE